MRECLCRWWWVNRQLTVLPFCDHFSNGIWCRSHFCSASCNRAQDTQTVSHSMHYFRSYQNVYEKAKMISDPEFIVHCPHFELPATITHDEFGTEFFGGPRLITIFWFRNHHLFLVHFTAYLFAIVFFFQLEERTGTYRGYGSLLWLLRSCTERH